MSDPLLEPPERVLSTMNPDGSRRWIRPLAAMGRWWRRRRVVAWILMVLFTALPWLSIGGKPVMLLDVAHRDFIFLGVTFKPTETLLLALLLLAVFFGIFLVSALLGRAWCGWACPQTVYLEFLYRPIERWVEGKGARSKDHKVAPWRVALKYGLYLALSLHLSNTFLAYFAGPRQVLQWSLHAPQAHPVAFGIVVAVTALMMFDFASFREQMCTLVCPYARLQSVLLDRDSLIVGYDRRRGEPRGKKRREDDAADTGDCIDCGLCVAACPTGIDIREGLQLECIACTQCIDACDAVMDKIKRPRDLVGFASQNGLDGLPHKLLRLRVVVYPVILVALLGGLIYGLVNRRMGEAMLLRNQAAVSVISGDSVIQTVVLRIDNRDELAHTYDAEIGEPAAVLGAQLPIEIEGFGYRTLNLPIRVPLSAFRDQRFELSLVVHDDEELRVELAQVLFEPAR